MKKTMKHILALVIILPFLFVSCQKSELEKESDNSIDQNTFKSAEEYCGDAKTVNLINYWNQTFNPGTVTVGNDMENLYVTYNTISPMTEIRLYVGQHAPDPNPYFDEILPDNVVHYYKAQFPYQDDGPATTKLFTIPLTDVMSDDGCFLIIAHALVDGQFVTGTENLKSYGWYFNYCLEECEIPEPECETAYAYGEDYATCFLNIPGVNSNNWGWSNGPLDEGTYSWPIYAGAGQCNIDHGTWVGTLDVDYSGGTCTVTYNIDSEFTLEETHLFVGDEYLPRNKKNKFTTAPGQFPYSGESSFTIDGLSGEIYVVAHSVVCGDYED
ncbi:MAG: hypothetical protein DRI95_09070 [Bacteroidetes bacterium]|nr:MAG: hypothetical protein DRI95_09070 [Bacteroidota bacterium]